MSEVTRPDGAVISYDAEGAGPPLLVLSGWRPGYAAPFADRFRVVTMDQRHMGRSRAPLVPFDYEAGVADQLAVLDALDIQRCRLVATGFGCLSALRLLYDAPARIESAVLLEPPGRDATNSMDTFYGLFRETIRTARAEGLDGVVAAAVAEGDFVANPAAGPWARRLHDEPAFRQTLCSLGRETYIALIVEFRDAMFPWNDALFAINDLALARIRQPLLVVAGDEPIHPEGVARRIGAEAANGQFVAREDLTPERLASFLTDHTGGA